MGQMTMERVQRGRHPTGWMFLPAFRVLALALLGHLCLHAAGETLEYQVKAAFLLNFTKFIEWPAAAFDSPDSPIVICILGEDPFGRQLDQVVEGEVVNGRKVTALRVKSLPPQKTCHVLFVAKADEDLRKSLPEVGPGVLTVGEGESFLRSGGTIAFVIENRRVRFGINETKAANAGLVVSSKLLNLARSVGK
jgi:YfiR/HmsC-like